MQIFLNSHWWTGIDLEETTIKKVQISVGIIVSKVWLQIHHPLGVLLEFCNFYIYTVAYLTLYSGHWWVTNPFNIMFMQLLISHGSAHQFYQFDSSCFFGKDKEIIAYARFPWWPHIIYDLGRLWSRLLNDNKSNSMLKPSAIHL